LLGEVEAHAGGLEEFGQGSGAAEGEAAAEGGDAGLSGSEPDNSHFSNQGLKKWRKSPVQAAIGETSPPEQCEMDLLSLTPINSLS